MQRVHFIAIGGGVMHNLAISLHKRGWQVSGSDDEIYEPSRTKLKEYGLLPKHEGWFPEKVTSDLDAVILAMHSNADNPELRKAQELGLKIYSYPEFIYQQCKKKKRVVIAGSHGKSTITSIVMHVLHYNSIPHDFLVAAEVEGVDVLVKLTDNAKIAILEGDEFFSSSLDESPKFTHYKANIGLLSGIGWDHANEFTTFEEYVDRFKKFVDSVQPSGTLIYNSKDKIVNQIVEDSTRRLNRIAYKTHPYEVFESRNFLKVKWGRIPVNIFGEHNMQYVAGAFQICQALDVEEDDFYRAIKHYKGASKRLQLLGRDSSNYIFWDYSHTPTKLVGTLKAVREQYSGREIIACMEMDSRVCSNREFLNQYKASMNLADVRYVYYNRKNFVDDGEDDIKPEEIHTAFGSPKLQVFTEVDALFKKIIRRNWKDKVLLLMSSGDFSGLDFSDLASKILKG